MTLSTPAPTDAGALAATRLAAADAIRTFCKSLGVGAVAISSDGVERIYYAGVSLDALSVAVTMALRNSAPQETRGDEPVAPTLDERQAVVIAWGAMAFGADHMADPIVRAARFIEEAAELVQAAGLSREHALRAFDHVYSRPAGELKQEVGGSANTLMALCGALGLSLDECQQAEIERCLAKDPAHFAARNQAKIREVDTAAPQQSPRLEREGVARIIDPRNFEMNEISANSYTEAGIKEALRKADAILALLSPDTTVVSSTSHREVYTPGVVSNREPIAGPINFIWPAGCQSPNSCHRNGRCMYVGCKHDGKDIRILAQLVPSKDRALKGLNDYHDHHPLASKDLP